MIGWYGERKGKVIGWCGERKGKVISVKRSRVLQRNVDNSPRLLLFKDTDAERVHVSCG